MKKALICAMATALASSASFGVVYTMNGFTIVDNDPVDTNYAETGFSGTDVNAHITGGFNNTRRWGNGGFGTSATWTFGTGGAGDPTLADGTYEVFVSWQDVAQSNLNNATYIGTDGFGPIVVDQEPGSLSYASTLGVETFFTTGIYAPGNVTFVRLGTVEIADGSFALTVTDDQFDADYIFVDAAALRAVPESSLLSVLLALSGGVLAVARRRR